MCEFCKGKLPRKRSWDSSGDRVVSYVGAIRRRNIHNNRTKQESRRLPERVIRNEWRAVENKKQQSEQLLRSDLEQLFSRQIQLLIKNLRERFGIKELKHFGEKARKPEDWHLVIDTVLDWSRWFDLTKEAAKDGTTKTLSEGFKTALERVGTSGPKLTPKQGGTERVIEELITNAARTQNTFRSIATQQVQRGLEEAESFDNIVRRVADKTEEQVGFRLDRIVQTTANGGFEFGQKEAFKEAGIERISWLSERDARVRAPSEGDKWNHRTADGQEIDIDSNFLLTGKGGRTESLRFPSDPLGSVGNIVYCRCSISPVS